MKRIIKKGKLAYVESEYCYRPLSNDKAFAGEAIDRLAAYEDTEMEPERVAELAQAEKDGRLVVLPCKVGDKVWVIMENREVYSAVVRGISMSATCTDTILRFSDSFQWGSNLGKTWFLTREEAEEALRKEADNG